VRPLRLPSTLAAYPGQWVLLRGQDVIAHAIRMDDLPRVPGSLLLRVPAVDEPELVGLG